MRMNLLQMAVLSIAALLFIHAALGIMTFCDKKICRKKGQIFYLNLLVLLMVCMTEAFHSPNRAMHILGLNILLTMALIDETTGYVYDVWNWLFLSICAFPGFVLQEWSSEKMLVAVFYFAAVFLAGVFHGIGAGDVPVLLSLFLYYRQWTDSLEKALITLLFLSFGIQTFRTLLQREKWLPFVPSIWAAHLITILMWG